MIYYGLEWKSLQGYFQFKEISSPNTPQADEIRIYAKDKAGVSALYLKDDAGSEREIGPASVVTGTGTANRLAYWISSSVLGAVSAITQGHVLFADANGLPTGEANLFWDNTNKRLGLGVATPSVRLEILSASEAFVDIYRTATDANAGGVRIAKSRSGGAVQSGDNIGLVGFGGHDGTAFRLNSGTIQAFAGSLWSGTNRETYIIFGTTPSGSVTRAERFRIGPVGQLGISGATFGTVGNLFQSGGASAAPSWLDHTTDFLSQYALLAGRSGGQTLNGDTASGGKLILHSTAHATKGDIDLHSADVTHLAAARFRMASQNRFRHLNSMARVKSTTAQTGLAVNTFVNFTYDAEDYDTDALHDNATNNSRITIKVAGKHNVTGSMAPIPNAGTPLVNPGSFYLAVFLNNTTLIGISNGAFDNNGNSGSCIALDYNFAVNDFIELRGQVTATSGQWNTQGPVDFEFFAAHYIGE